MNQSLNLTLPDPVVMSEEPKQYGELWMHREMLFDRVRCEAFRSAIFNLVKPGMTVSA